MSCRSRYRAALRVERLEDRTAPAAAAVLEAPVLPVIDAPMKAHLREVFLRGQALGRRADAFAKVGDSHTYWNHNLTELGSPFYNPAAPGALAEYPELVGVAARYRAPVDRTLANSFTRESSASFGGWTSAETRLFLPLELEQIRPAVALIMVGTNDQVIGRPVEQYRANLAAMVGSALARGVIPVLSTIPYLFNFAADALIDPYNEAVVSVAREFGVPLWNFWLSQRNLPRRGTIGDNAHLTTSPRGGGAFAPDDLQYGYNLRHLQTLQVLEKLDRIVFRDGEPDLPLPPSAAPWAPLEPGQPVFVAGAAPGGQPVVRVFDATSGAAHSAFFAFEPGFTGGVRVAAGDVNGDGTADVIAAPAGMGGPVVKVFDGRDGSLVHHFFAFVPDFLGGVSLAAADVDGDGRADIIAGAGRGGGPQVRVFRGGSLELLHDFFAFEPGFRGGVNVAAGDVNGDGSADVIVGAGEGGGPRVAVRDGRSGAPLADFFAYAASVRAGVYVAAGDLDGDGADELLTGAGEGGPHVGVFDGMTGGGRGGFFADDPARTGGVRVAAVRDRDGRVRILAKPGARGDPFVRIFGGAGAEALGAVRVGDPFAGGIDVGGMIELLGISVDANAIGPR